MIIASMIAFSGALRVVKELGASKVSYEALASGAMMVIRNIAVQAWEDRDLNQHYNGRAWTIGRIAKNLKHQEKGAVKDGSGETTKMLMRSSREVSVEKSQI